jgi:hypothetical protein
MGRGGWPLPSDRMLCGLTPSVEAQDLALELEESTSTNDQVIQALDVEHFPSLEDQIQGCSTRVIGTFILVDSTSREL